MFLCPSCDQASLDIARSIRLNADLAASDELYLQIVTCGRCSFRGAAVYEESRRGSPDSETWHHYGVAAPADAIAALNDLIATCPNPKKSRCSCDAHQRISQRDAEGHWRPPLPAGARQFPMKRSR